MSIFITLLLESSVFTSGDVWHIVNSLALGHMAPRCCFVMEVIGNNRTFPPACFSFAEEAVEVCLVGGVLEADCGDVSLSPPPPLAKEKLDFEADCCGDISLSPPPPLAKEKLDFEPDACGDVSLSPPPPLAKEKPDFDGGVFAAVCGDISVSPPPPFAKEKPDFDGEVNDTDDEAFGVGDATITSSFLLPLIVALLSLVTTPTKKC